MIIQYGATGIVFILLMLFAAPPLSAQSDAGKIKCICIDPGHGGHDPGAMGTKAKEKDVVLDIALKVGKMIETTYPDVKVVYTRKKDIYLAPHERSQLANQRKANLFLSIHANSLDVKAKPGNKYIKGVETYIMGFNHSEHNLQVAMKENSVIHFEKDNSVKYEGFDPSKPESYIIFNILQSVYQEKSLSLASFIHSSVVKNTQRVDREVRRGPIWVLKDVAMPAVLVEVGYISNPEDERYMMSAAGQEKIAKGIFQGFQEYKKKEEKHLKNLPESTVTPPPVSPAKVVPADNSSKNEGDGPIYAIQVASATARIKNTSRLCAGEKVHELVSGGRYRYYVAPSAKLETVKGRLTQVKSKVHDCFIIAIYKGKVMTVAEARKLEQKQK